MFPVILLALWLPVPGRILPGGDVLMSSKARAGEPPAVQPERTMPPARNPDVAVAEEYEIARRSGTAEALELFIARHPDSALADRARSELRQIKR
ncbi:MAG: hypothetical protein DI543_15360 [Bradyrhizobium icense]|nr:MAG: hypothetical protein DI543_15360 [Bradyrhizobium icense]